MNITLVISSLNSGGAERVLAGMANWWASKGVCVTLITFSSGSDFYPLNPDIRRVRLGMLRKSRCLLDAMGMFVRRLFGLRCAILDSKPDCVLSFVDKTNVMTLLACMGTKLRVVVSERTNPNYYPLSRIWSLLRDIIYRRAYAVVVQTEALRVWAEKRVAATRVAVVPNALDRERLALMSQGVAPHVEAGIFRIVAVGRMTQEKGHDLLIRACAKVLPSHPDWRLELVGDGPLRSLLEQQAERSGIGRQVHFHGQLKNPFVVMKSADLFVLPSRVEGFPNVLLEAMALGLPVISFDCPSGPSELIIHRVSGLLALAADVDALAAAIQFLIQDLNFRTALGAEAYRIRERYSENKMMKEWSRVAGI